MAEKNYVEYLFLLTKPSYSALQSASQSARKNNLIVAAKFHQHAIIVLGDAPQMTRLYKTGLFQHHTPKAVPKTVWSKMKDPMRSIVLQWNHRFSKTYQAEAAAAAKVKAKPWDKIPDASAYHSHFDPELLLKKIKEYGAEKRLRKPKESTTELLKKYKIDFKGGGFGAIIEYLQAILKSKYNALIRGFVYRLRYADIKWVLKPGWADATATTISALEAGEPCRTLHGEISIGVVFVDSTPAIGRIVSQTNKNSLQLQVQQGLTWLATQHPSGNLSFNYDFQTVEIDVPNIPNPSDTASSVADAYWRNPGIGAIDFNGLTFSPDDAGLAAYKQAMMQAHGSNDSVVYFITRYGSSWFGYSSGERFIVIAETSSNWAANPPRKTSTFVQQLLRQFGAADEYGSAENPCSSCEEEFGCDHIPNGNCYTCAISYRGCVMQFGYLLDICEYTKGQIGWADIFVELTTDDEYYSGTKDNVWLDIGHRTYQLSLDVRDKKRRDRDGYAIWDGGNITRDQIKRILIRKAEDGSGGSGGGWKLRGVKVFHDCEMIANDSPGVWLQNYDLHFLSNSYVPNNNLVNTLELRVITGDVYGAGTDSRVTLQLGGRNFPLESTQNDFSRDSNRTYILDPGTGLRVADITVIQVTKSISWGTAWNLGGLTLIVNGVTLYENLSINQWLDNDDSRVFNDVIS